MRATATGDGPSGSAGKLQQPPGISSSTSSSGGNGSDAGRYSVLSWEQVQRLDQILEEAVPIHGRGNFPTLSVKPRRIVQITLYK